MEIIILRVGLREWGSDEIVRNRYTRGGVCAEV